jgi:fumarylacetoacetate (FAA) hydrolase
MRLATVFDRDSNEPRPVFELPGGQRVELRELFRAESPASLPPEATGDDAIDHELSELPLYFTDLAKTVEFLDDVVDAIRDWARHQADRPESESRERESTRVDAMSFLPPVPAPRSFREFDAFEQHAKAWRARHDLKISPVWYDAPSFVFANAGSLTGHESPVHAPTESEELDYGLQLAAIVGRGGRDIKARDAWRHIAGFTIVNSFAARDIERREIAMAVGRGKSRDFATAVGPYLVPLSSLRDRVDADDRLHLAMRALINGNELSRADASQMFFTWPQLIEHASRDAELYPGDVISSGIVGTGSVLDLGGSNAAPWLKAGDVVELEVERLGILRTPIVHRPSRVTNGVAQTGAILAQRTALST